MCRYFLEECVTEMSVFCKLANFYQFNQRKSEVTFTWARILGNLGKGKNEMLSDVGGLSVLDVQSFKENCVCAMTRHHSEPNSILLTRSLPFDSDGREWSHPLMIPLHSSWAKSNNRTRVEFECDVIWFCFCFDFVQIKQVDCKMGTKNVNNYKWKTFRNVFGQLHIQEYKATKKQMRFQLDENKSKGSRPDGKTW